MITAGKTGTPPPGGVLGYYRHALETRGLHPDQAQIQAAERLQAFYTELVDFKHRRRTKLRKLLVRPQLPRGVYLWGGVGRGKSFLMECFFGALPYVRKRRVHFHAFMREVHQGLEKNRKEADPLMAVADRIAHQTRVFCFDEFHVSDIADAMILGRLMGALFERGVVFCVTSNYPPDGLYPDGLQRANFLPAIKLVNERLDVIEVDGGIDYRLRELQRMEAWLMPPGPVADAKLEADFVALAGGEGKARPLKVNDREVPTLRRGGGVAWFDFRSLCGGPRSQLDYLEIARDYHTVLLSNIPRMNALMSSEARRFTWLVDVLYEHKVKLVASSEADGTDIYAEGPQSGEFARTASRLFEMRTLPYLSAAHRADGASG